MGPAIVLERAGVSLGGQAILRGLDLEVRPGEVVGIAGPNGSGKTTLLRLVATLVAPSDGAGRVLGSALGSPAVWEVRRRIGLISHTPTVIGELTLTENLTHAIRLIGGDPERVTAALRAVGLDEAGGRRGGASSFGMLRRTEIARLLLTSPSLLLLDEAFSGLDGDAQELMDALVARTTAAGGATVMVSHDTEHLGLRVGRLMALRSGRLEPLG